MSTDPDVFRERKPFFEPPAPLITPKIDPKVLPSLYRKRRNASPEKPPDDSKDLDGLDPKTCEIFTKFLTSQGLPLEAIKDTIFQNLFYSLDSSKIIPTPEILKEYTEKMANPKKYSQALSKSTGPLSVTIDVIEKENGDNYLAFSIHFFEGFEERKCLINLKKILITKIEAECILTAVRRAINILNHNQVKISNFVVSNGRMFEMFKPYNDVIRHQFISFHHYLRYFVRNILNIQELATGIKMLRSFVALIKTIPNVYHYFRTSQLANEGRLDLPNLDDRNCWFSTATFLTNCLILHPTFEALVKRWKFAYITSATFDKLAFLYQLLHQCIKHVRDISGEYNSISQVIPTILSIRNYIEENLSEGCDLKSDIRNAFFNAFQDVISGQMSRRYDMATLLDPRFAYDESIYSKDRWSDKEEAVIEEVLNKTDSCEELSNSTRIQKIQNELTLYRRMCNNRPHESANPFQWWNSQKDNLENLVLIAREYLACPAVSIDAQQFFGSGGKFSNLVEIYDSKSLESYLNCAGHHQQFIGHGSNIEHIPEREIANLNQSIDAKRQREMYHQMRLEGGPSDPEARKMYHQVLSIGERPSNQIPEIHPEDVKLEDVDSQVLEDSKVSKDPANREDQQDSTKKGIKPEPLDDDYALVEKEPRPPKAKSTKWALGKPMTILTSSSSTQSSNQMLKFLPQMNCGSFDDFTELMEHDEPDIKRSWSPTFKEWALGQTSDILTSSSQFKEASNPRRKKERRRCILCGTVRNRVDIKSVTIDNEKLFILLGSVLGKRLELIPAQDQYFREQIKSNYCRYHFQESCLEIFKELGVKTPGDIQNCPEAKFERILELIEQIRHSPSTFVLAKLMLTSVTRKYFIRSKSPCSQTFQKATANEEPEIVQEEEEEEIIPKAERVPRKQTFEKDTESTVRIIETVPFKLPDYSKEPVTELSENMRKCCFCLLTINRNGMLRVPKSHDRLQKWIHKFGEEFVKRLDFNGENYICRSHFSPSAFSRNKRLLKGMMPEIEVVKSEVTYHIDGDNFWRIEEPEEVDDPTISQRIDDGQVTGETSENVVTSKLPGRPRGRPRKESRLEVPRPSYEMPEARESSDDAEKRSSPDFSGDYKHPSRPRRKPTKYQDIEDVEEDSEDEKTRIYNGPMLDYQKPWPIKQKKLKIEDDSEDDQICRFCSETINKTDAIKGNKNCIRLSEWIKYLGVDFVKKLDYKSDNYVCKKHFRVPKLETGEW